MNLPRFACRDVPPLRLGLVPYLNVHLMAHGLAEACPHLRLRSGTPRELERLLSAGAIDLGTVPVFAAFGQSRRGVAPAPVIAAKREVRSVIIVADEPLDRLRRVYRDPHSVTSNALLAVLAKRAWGGAIELVDPPVRTVSGPVSDETENGRPDRMTDAANREPLPPGVGRLLIGDPALRERDAYPYIVDLGAEWRGWTGLPFVFAAWIGPHNTRIGALPALLLAVARRNQARLEEAAAAYDQLPELTIAERARYLRDNISMRFGPPEREALHRFHAEAVALGLAPPGPPPPWIGGDDAVKVWDALEAVE